MRALVFHGPGDLRTEDRELAPVEGGDAEIRVEACGICGTDLKILRGQHRAYPAGTVRIPGHEVVGRVTRLTAETPGVREGDRVVVAPNIGCGRCAACRAGRPNLCARYEGVGLTFDGGFAERLRVPAAAVTQGNLLVVPSNGDAAALTLVEPLAAVLRGARAVGVASGDVVVVVGAGPIGLLHVLVAAARGAARIIVSEPSADRRAQALAMGATDTVDPTTQDLPDAVRELTGGDGASVVIVAVPVAAAFAQALELAAVGGRINFFAGLPADAGTVALAANTIHYRELVVTGTTANTTDDCREARDTIVSGELDVAPLVSARYGLEAGSEAFDEAAGGRSMKVVVQA